jgi:hypothetical protein
LTSSTEVVGSEVAHRALLIDNGNERMAKRAFGDYFIPKVAYPEFIDCGRGFPSEAAALC